MEALSDLKKENMNEGFFKYVFNFDDDNKSMILNLFQYSFISMPLIIIILKMINYYTPEEDEEKGSLEIFLEIISSISVLLLSIWFINKIVRYIPTYSQMEYATFNETNFLLAFLILLFTMQTKLGSKINILLERLADLYEGKTNLKNSNQTKTKDYKTTQPIAQSNFNQPPIHQPSQSDFLNKNQANNSNNVNTQFNNSVHNTGVQQQPDFNNMYGPSNPLVNAQEPQAANEAFGGIFGASSLF